jgi:hypothetical protein
MVFRPPVTLLSVVCLMSLPYAALLFGQEDLPVAQPTDQQMPVRVATFNCSLNRDTQGQLLKELQGGQCVQARKVARILRTVRPQVVLLNEFDFDPEGAAIRTFLDEYVSAEVAWSQEPALFFPHFYAGPVNTGVASGRDLNHDGKADGPADALGFGLFPGQYGMVILSQFPIDHSSVRTFQKLLWSSMPEAALPPNGSDDGTPWYSAEDLKVLRLSSKSHWDVPISIDGQTLHLLASHPTPPAFDGPEDRNGRRNHDEIRLWAEYLTATPKPWLIDDKGVAGPLQADASFVILGDQNADPADGDSFQNAIHQLLHHPRINSKIAPTSQGGRAAATSQRGVNQKHLSDASHDTADFSDRSVGNLRADYVLPSENLHVASSGIFWPTPDEPAAELIDCSDHRLVWIDIRLHSRVTR